jgi:hypothetical protein
VPNVRLNISGPTNHAINNDTSGFYRQNIFKGGLYSIGAQKGREINKLNGLSTLDLILIQRHVVLLDTISNIYNGIAADVNQNGIISTADALIAQRQILGLDSLIQNSSNWVFYPSSQSLSSVYPYGLANASLISSGSDSIDFTGIRLGDVNNSWNSSLYKTKKVLALLLSSRYVGNDTIEIKLNNISQEEILGLSGSMDEISGSELTSSIPAFSTHSSSGIMKFNGYTPEFGIGPFGNILEYKIHNPMHLPADELIKKMKLEGVNAKLEEVEFEFNIGSFSVQDFRGVKTVILPNPNNGEFSIKSGKIINSVVVFSSSGMRVHSKDGIKASEVVLNCSNLAQGLYFINIKFSDGTADSEKMIIAQ